jgi:hypothetical protein
VIPAKVGHYEGYPALHCNGHSPTTSPEFPTDEYQIASLRSKTRPADVVVATSQDGVSTSQNENLERAVDFRNSQTPEVVAAVGSTPMKRPASLWAANVLD